MLIIPLYINYFLLIGAQDESLRMEQPKINLGFRASIHILATRFEMSDLNNASNLWAKPCPRRRLFSQFPLQMKSIPIIFNCLQLLYLRFVCLTAKCGQ